MTYCQECGSEIPRTRGSTAICNKCQEGIWKQLKEWQPILPQAEKRDPKVYYVPEKTSNAQSFSTKHLEKGEEIDRTCLKCSKKFQTLGKFTRICDACKDNMEYTDEPLTIY